MFLHFPDQKTKAKQVEIWRAVTFLHVLELDPLVNPFYDTSEPKKR